MSGFAGLEVEPKDLENAVDAVTGIEEEAAVARDGLLIGRGEVAGNGGAGEAVDVEFGSGIRVADDLAGEYAPFLEAEQGRGEESATGAAG